MTRALTPLSEVTTEAIRVLCREIGPVNTARFLNQFTTGFGNYTEERDKRQEAQSVDQLVAEIRQWRRKKRDPQKSAPRPPRRTNR